MGFCPCTFRGKVNCLATADQQKRGKPSRFHCLQTEDQLIGLSDQLFKTGNGIFMMIKLAGNDLRNHTYSPHLFLCQSLRKAHMSSHVIWSLEGSCVFVCLFIFSNFARFCTPKRCTRVQCLVQKKTTLITWIFGRAWYPLDIRVGPPPPPKTHLFLYYYRKMFVFLFLVLRRGQFYN